MQEFDETLLFVRDSRHDATPAHAEPARARCRRADPSFSANYVARGRPAHDQLRLEEQLLGRHLGALHPAGQHRDRGPADRLDRLPDGGQRRVGAVHEGRVVEADHRDVGRAPTARRGAPRASRRAPAGRWRTRSPWRRGRSAGSPRPGRPRGRTSCARRARRCAAPSAAAAASNAVELAPRRHVVGRARGSARSARGPSEVRCP